MPATLRKISNPAEVLGILGTEITAAKLLEARERAFAELEAYGRKYPGVEPPVSYNEIKEAFDSLNRELEGFEEVEGDDSPLPAELIPGLKELMSSNETPKKKDLPTLGKHHARRAREAGMQEKLLALVEAANKNGEPVLKKLRLEVDCPPEDLAGSTKIPLKYIIALEEEEIINMPAPVYFRGYVAAYLKYLGIEDTTVLNSVVEYYRKKSRTR